MMSMWVLTGCSHCTMGSRQMGAVGPHPTPVLKAEPPQAGCPGLCPVWIWMSPRMEIPKFSGPVFDYHIVKNLCLGFFIFIFLMFKGNFMCSRFYPLSACPVSVLSPQKGVWLILFCSPWPPPGIFKHSCSLLLMVSYYLLNHFFPPKWLQTVCFHFGKNYFICKCALH